MIQSKTAGMFFIRRFRMEKKFTPKPGDKIICNNGEEFICCTLEFLNENGLAKCWEGGSIFGYQHAEDKSYTKYNWQYWDETGREGNGGWSIREIIPQSSEVTADKKEEVKEEPRYTVDEVFDAIFEETKHIDIEVPWDYIDDVKEHLSRKNDPQYMEYLRLKAIYE